MIIRVSPKDQAQGKRDLYYFKGLSLDQHYERKNALHGPSLSLFIWNTTLFFRDVFQQSLSLAS